MNKLNIRQELWAQYYTVGPEGLECSDGQLAYRPDAQDAKRIATEPGQLRDIMWMDFCFVVGEPCTDEEAYYGVGLNESFIATSRRTTDEVVFQPVSEVVDSGKLSTYSATWLGKLASGGGDIVPDRFQDLLLMTTK